MTEREFLIYLDPETRLCRYRHYHISDGKEIIEFRIQLEILVNGEWYAVVRYDTAHGNPTGIFFIQMASRQKIGLKGILWQMYSQLVKVTLWKTGLRIGIVLSRR